MNDLQKLQQKKANYINLKADEIQAVMIRRNSLSYEVSTCDYRGWDREFYRNFNDIASELRTRGFKVNSSVNHDVTDWIITL